MIAIALLIISAIIGAGFATGAELVAFFGNTGIHPVIIAILVGLTLFAIMAMLVLFEKKPIRGTRHVFSAIYLATFIVMTAGLRHIVGTFPTIVALCFCILVVFCGFRHMLWINKYLMYFVLGILIFASVSNLVPASSSDSPPPRIFHGIWMVVLYAGLNCCIMQRVLQSLRKDHPRKKILAACALACVLIAILVALVLIAIFNQNVTADMPILELSNTPLTRFAVFLCILTSMMILLYNLTQNSPSKGSGCFSAIGYSTLAFAFSFFGFKSILGFVYPLIGGFMILYVLCLCVLHFFGKNRLVVHDTVNCLEIIQDE